NRRKGTSRRRHWWRDERVLSGLAGDYSPDGDRLGRLQAGPGLPEKDATGKEPGRQARRHFGAFPDRMDPLLLPDRRRGVAGVIGVDGGRIFEGKGPDHLQVLRVPP